ncbi:hypothetical protein GSY69_01565 [Brevibacterium sp. 5221]|uniref:HNH nuclease domain-containing protein n=1 Tax=Brevibacterium rongguiense TaxID=2695267 RepID=A0A6N9H3S4_9MICO|nr:HNH endonuclease [Brevibacterium rongguiense]MYM18698.1 hypothetical protein [Brevibacterium rongguiense]
MAPPARRIPGSSALREPRPHRYDAAVFAGIHEATALASRQRLRQLLGAGMTALDAALAHGDLDRLGISSGMLLRTDSDLDADDQARCDACGDCVPPDPGVSSSMPDQFRAQAPHGTQALHSAQAPNGAQAPRRAVAQPASFDGMDSATAAEATATVDSQYSLEACTCTAGTLATDDLPAADEALFNLPTAEPRGQTAPTDEALPDPIPWADQVPYDCELIPVARIRALLNAHVPHAVPSHVYDGTQQRLGMTIAHCLDITETRATGLIADALTAILGLPELTDQARRGIIDTRKLETAAHLGGDLSLAQLTHVDAHLAALSPAMRLADFRRHAARLIATLSGPAEAAEQVHSQRRIEYWANRDGSATLCLIGPVAEVAALHERVRAVARAVRRSELGAFGQQAPAGTQVVDERTIGQLCFDMLASYAPQVTVQAVIPTRDDLTADGGVGASAGRSSEGVPVAARGPGQGATSSSSPPTACFAHPHSSATCNSATSENRRTPKAQGRGVPAPASGGGPDSITGSPPARCAVAHPARAPVEASASGQTVVITLTCPTNAEWLRRQATVALTLPLLTYTGDSDLPGELADGSPVPADAARRIAAGQSTLRRILTDPADGRVLDAHARSYTIPAALRAVVEAKWQHCTAPGCTRRADACELDHRTPFDHADPAAGGRTDFSNLHPLCKRHHQMKTAGILTPVRTSEGMLTWQLNGELTARTAVPGNPINSAHAEQLQTLIDSTDGQAHSAGTASPTADARSDPPPF